MAITPNTVYFFLKILTIPLFILISSVHGPHSFHVNHHPALLKGLDNEA